MPAPSPAVTAVEAHRHARAGRLNLAFVLFAFVAALGLAVLVAAVVIALRLADGSTPSYADPVEHFKYGSIGAEPSSGVPRAIWDLLPTLYPEEFGGRNDFSAFGFLYETDADGRQRALPIGISKRNVSGVEVVWLNCATCHTGTVRLSDGAPRRIVPGMPSNNLDFGRFVQVIMKLSVDERLAPDRLFPLLKANGTDLGRLDRLIWRVGVLPRFREGLVSVRQRLLPLFDLQPAWGPGRVDTFNPYKLIQFGLGADNLTPAELIGVADLPAVFEQGPRRDMNLHWDGNNTSLKERNLSAAIGAGVTPKSVDHMAIGLVADWLLTLKAPPSPNAPDPDMIARGKAIYAKVCADCHGRQEADSYVFEGEYLGEVEPIERIKTDRARLDSYTDALRNLQLTRLFVGSPYQFQYFRKTGGYANLPLDGLWLRAPYLHNGSVPTLADLLNPAAERPRAFLRGIDVVDPVNGGFLAPPCDPSVQPGGNAYCHDATLPGNGPGGHLYGTDLQPADKTALLAYLLTF
jgi:hypothetical protein